MGKGPKRSTGRESIEEARKYQPVPPADPCPDHVPGTEPFSEGEPVPAKSPHIASHLSTDELTTRIRILSPLEKGAVLSELIDGLDALEGVARYVNELPLAIAAAIYQSLNQPRREEGSSADRASPTLQLALALNDPKSTSEVLALLNPAQHAADFVDGDSVVLSAILRLSPLVKAAVLNELFEVLQPLTDLGERVGQLPPEVRLPVVKRYKEPLDLVCRAKKPPGTEVFHLYEALTKPESQSKLLDMLSEADRQHIRDEREGRLPSEDESTGEGAIRDKVTVSTQLREILERVENPGVSDLSLSEDDAASLANDLRRLADSLSSSTPPLERMTGQEIITALRDEFQMSLRQIADQIGVDASNICRIADGSTRQPRPNLVEKLRELIQKRRTNSKQ